MKKRFLGIPVSIISVLVAVMLVGAGVAAYWTFTQELPGQVKIMGADCAVYEDEACTIPLTELDFGEMGAGDTSSPIAAYVKNTGDGSIYVAMQQAELDPLLTLYADGSVVPADPGKLKLITDSDYAEGYWQAGSPSTTLLGGIDASTATIEVASISGFPASGELWCEGEVIAYTGLRPYEAEQPEIPGQYQETGITTTLNVAMDTSQNNILTTGLSGFPGSGVVKVDDELMKYNSKDLQVLQGVTRGFDGTTPASHSQGATVYLMELGDPIPGSSEVLAAFTGCTRGSEGTLPLSHSSGVAISVAEWVGETGGELFDLQADEVLKVELTLAADPEIERSLKEFIVTFLAQDTPYL